MADDPHTPTSAIAMIGDFTFFAGKPNKDVSPIGLYLLAE